MYTLHYILISVGMAFCEQHCYKTYIHTPTSTGVYLCMCISICICIYSLRSFSTVSANNLAVPQCAVCSHIRAYRITCVCVCAYFSRIIYIYICTYFFTVLSHTILHCYTSFNLSSRNILLYISNTSSIFGLSQALSTRLVHLWLPQGGQRASERIQEGSSLFHGF